MLLFGKQSSEYLSEILLYPFFNVAFPKCVNMIRYLNGGGETKNVSSFLFTAKGNALPIFFGLISISPVCISKKYPLFLLKFYNF